jgi:colanic acid/amylovoran biosynthesis glycosyltransferase
MKIAYFVDSFPMISETFVISQITGMIDRGHEVRIFSNRLVRQNIQHKSIEQYGLLDKTVVVPQVPRNPLKRLVPALKGLLGAMKRRRLGAAVKALSIVRFGRRSLGLSLFIRATGNYEPVAFDVIHCQFGHLGVMVQELRECGAISGSLVTSFRGADVMRYASSEPERFSGLFASGEQFLAVSSIIKDRLAELGCPADRTQVLRSGIDLGRFKQRQLRNPGDVVRLISVGRLAPNKGVEVALEAVKILGNAGKNVHFRVLGAGPCESSLHEQVRELGIEAAVTFEGAVDSDRVIEALNESEILLAPTTSGLHGDQEGLPNCLKEAMAIGVVAVGSEMGSIPELITDGENGFLVEQRDAPALAEAVEKIIENWGGMAQVVAEARRTVESEYDIEQLNDVLERTYRKSVECLH